MFFGLRLSQFLTQLSHNFSILKLFKHAHLYPHSLLLTSLIMILGLSLDSDTQRQRYKYQIYDLHIINSYKLFWGDSSEQLMLIILHVSGFRNCLQQILACLLLVFCCWRIIYSVFSPSPLRLHPYHTPPPSNIIGTERC